MSVIEISEMFVTHLYKKFCFNFSLLTYSSIYLCLNKYSIISNAWFRSILSVKIEKNYHKLQFFKKMSVIFQQFLKILFSPLFLKIDFPDGKGGSNQNAFSVSRHHNIFLFIGHLIFSCVFPETIFGECENFRHMNLYQ